MAGTEPGHDGHHHPRPLSLRLDLRRPVRPAAEARARVAAAGDDRHGLPRRRQDHAGPAISQDAGGPRHGAGGQRVRLGRHRRRAAARNHRRDHAARQRLPVLQHAQRSADRAAAAGRRPRARQDPAFRPRADRNQRPRRHQPDPADVLDRSRARRRVRRRGRAGGGGCAERAAQSRQGARGAQAGDPGGPPGGLQDRPRRQPDQEAARRHGSRRSTRAPTSTWCSTAGSIPST